ncbi:white collar 2 type of transcription factor [Microbotryomycetes sp. JL201]|nr:white collar 2 type of transcription factor [Microbotryomycetes sp. JL201]
MWAEIARKGAAKGLGAETDENDDGKVRPLWLCTYLDEAQAKFEKGGRPRQGARSMSSNYWQASYDQAGGSGSSLDQFDDPQYVTYTQDQQRHQHEQQQQQLQQHQQQSRRDAQMADTAPLMHRRNHSLGGQGGSIAQQHMQAAQQQTAASAQQQQLGQAAGSHQAHMSGDQQHRRQSAGQAALPRPATAGEPMPIAAPALTQPSTHTVKASSTTSEFTKRKNWSQHIIDEIQDFMHVLSPSGDFIFVTPSIQDMAGWTPDELVGRSISDFVHKDDVEGYRSDFQQSLQDGKDLTLYCRFRTKDNGYVLYEMTGHPYYTDVTGQQSCKCFFGMGRPYPSKNQAMLDSFLELKFENERLRQELQTLYKDIESSGGDDLLKNLSERSESVIDPVTGLVQANGLLPSSSNTYGALGIGISTNTPSKQEGSEKKKKASAELARLVPSAESTDRFIVQKPRVEEGEFVCRDCGTVDSPEWRKASLRYAKLTSKAAKAAKAEREKK